ncbi:hypothetical protein CAFE_07430 [Caprobacter fermentans]|uniref:Uncharacterized protein n=1 Tax=Caproicibacter fermentans TaxID=2576756 RepID=A0A6N8HX15_9FIRM|nr:hypothetical protein [Caproicibacter fermentans]MVB10070.1 hypothetical protein [Caproicibacter fermentans]
MATSNHTANYSLSQYVANDPVEFLTNYNQDMAVIDAAPKAIKDEADASVPNARKIVGLALSADITAAQPLAAAGIASGDPSGNAQNALKLRGKAASLFPSTDVIAMQSLSLLNGWRTIGGNFLAIWFGRIVYIGFKDDTFSGTPDTMVAAIPDGSRFPNDLQYLNSFPSSTIIAIYHLIMPNRVCFRCQTLSQKHSERAWPGEWNSKGVFV